MIGRESSFDTTDSIDDLVAEQKRIEYVGEETAMRAGLRSEIDRYNAVRTSEAAAHGSSLAPTLRNATQLGLISSDLLLEGLASTSEAYPLRAEPPIVARNLQPLESVVSPAHEQALVGY
jgi:hypothetical protein